MVANKQIWLNEDTKYMLDKIRVAKKLHFYDQTIRYLIKQANGKLQEEIDSIK